MQMPGSAPGVARHSLPSSVCVISEPVPEPIARKYVPKSATRAELQRASGVDPGGEPPMCIRVPALTVGPNAIAVSHVIYVSALLEAAVRPGDAILTLGAGDVYRLARALAEENR